jgi:hypothetical protein
VLCLDDFSLWFYSFKTFKRNSLFIFLFSCWMGVEADIGEKSQFRGELDGGYANYL